MSFFETDFTFEELDAAVTQDGIDFREGMSKVDTRNKGKTNVDADFGGEEPMEQDASEKKGEGSSSGGIEVNFDFNAEIKVPASLNAATAVAAVAQRKWDKPKFGNLISKLGTANTKRLTMFLGALNTSSTGKVHQDEASSLGAVSYCDVSLLSMTKKRDHGMLAVPCAGWKSYIARMYPGRISFVDKIMSLDGIRMSNNFYANEILSDGNKNIIRSTTSKFVDFVAMTEDNLDFARCLHFYFKFQVEEGKWVVVKRGLLGKDKLFNMYYVDTNLTSAKEFKAFVEFADQFKGMTVKKPVLAAVMPVYALAHEIHVLKAENPMRELIIEFNKKRDAIEANNFKALPDSDKVKRLFLEQARNRTFRAQVALIPEMDYQFAALDFVPRSERNSIINKFYNLVKYEAKGKNRLYEMEGSTEPAKEALEAYFSGEVVGDEVYHYMPMLNPFIPDLMTVMAAYVAKNKFLSFSVFHQPQAHSRWLYLRFNKQDIGEYKCLLDGKSVFVLNYKRMVMETIPKIYAGEVEYMFKLSTGVYYHTGKSAIRIEGKAKKKVYYDYKEDVKYDEQL